MDKNIIKNILGILDSIDVGSIFKQERQFSSAWLLGQLTGGTLVKMQIRFKNYAENGVDVADFMRIILELVDVARPNLFHLAMASIQLYQNICEAYALSEIVRFRDVTNYIIDVTGSENRTKSRNTRPRTPFRPKSCRSRTTSASAAKPGRST